MIDFYSLGEYGKLFLFLLFGLFSVYGLVTFHNLVYQTGCLAVMIYSIFYIYCEFRTGSWCGASL